jgi:hypothetical protein
MRAAQLAQAAAPQSPGALGSGCSQPRPQAAAVSARMGSVPAPAPAPPPRRSCRCAPRVPSWARTPSSSRARPEALALANKSSSSRSPFFFPAPPPPWSFIPRHRRPCGAPTSPLPRRLEAPAPTRRRRRHNVAQGPRHQATAEPRRRPHRGRCRGPRRRAFAEPRPRDAALSPGTLPWRGAPPSRNAGLRQHLAELLPRRRRSPRRRAARGVHGPDLALEPRPRASRPHRVVTAASRSPSATAWCPRNPRRLRLRPCRPW